MKSFAIATLFALSFSAALTEAAALDGGTQKRVRAATFEVVVPKAPDDAVKYERPPPYELLSYAERTDKFWSVGTAFAISADTFVTAAHVLSGAVGGQGGPPVLRDAQGRTFPIERVLKAESCAPAVVEVERRVRHDLPCTRAVCCDDSQGLNRVPPCPRDIRQQPRAAAKSLSHGGRNGARQRKASSHARLESRERRAVEREIALDLVFDLRTIRSRLATSYVWRTAR